jgi:porin
MGRDDEQAIGIVGEGDFMRLISMSAALLSTLALVPVLAQETRPADREGPQVQAEAQDVTGGLEPEPSTDFSPDEHLLGDPGGFRTQLAERGISIDPLLTMDYAKNLHGGADTAGDAWLHCFNLYITVQTEPLLGLKGGSFYVDLLQQHGQSPSDEAGDYALVDELDFGGRTQVNEIWYEQKLLEEQLRIKLGKIDANTEFCVAENSFDFSNGGLSYGFPNSQFNFMPTVPDNAFGAVLFVYPSESCYIGAGVFDGALQEGFAGDYGPSTLFGEPADLYIAAEAGCKFDVAGNPWRVALGGFHHTGTFDEFDAGAQGGNSGLWALLDATLWKENPGEQDDEQGLGAFFVYDTADSEVTEVDQHFGAGLAWTGALPGRDSDVVGLGASYSHFSGGAGFLDTGELVIEAFYKLAVTDYLSVKGDLQYIRDPGGAGLNDALAALVRVQIAF